VGSLAIAPGAGSGAEPPSQIAAPQKAIEFNRDIRPILSNNCFRCHGPDSEQREADLRLDLRDEAVRPAESGKPAIVPGKPRESGLVERVFSSRKGVMMPPPASNKTLTDADKRLLARWIEQGAKYDTHWSFVAPKRPEVPTTVRRNWARNPIDDFILARLEAEGLTPSAEADKTTLIRRVTLDLTGLPPTLREIDAFLADGRAEAYDSVVDRLLASPHFGERLALEWLDAARYADTHGYHLDSGRDMTHWREWVIDAFNDNMPFDQFTVEQLAGDLLPNPTVSQQIASGFHRNHMINFEGGAIPEEYQTAYVIDRVNTTATVWMGLTLGCAQCHDHKFDPLTQKDYYRLYAFFNSISEKGLDGNTGNAEPKLTLPTGKLTRELKRLSAELADVERQLTDCRTDVDAEQAEWERTVGEPVKGAKASRPTASPPKNIATIVALASASRTADQAAELRSYYRKAVSPALRPINERATRLRKEIADLEAKQPTTMVMRELPQKRDSFMLVRGQYDQRGAKVEPGVPDCLPSLPDGVPANRLGLARWLVNPSHPLTSRVIVNRYWQIFFGTGLVRTAEDFGVQGELPSHRELIDWLAVEFRGNWNVKSLVRRIVTSSTYRQSSVVTPQSLARDPENRLLAHGPRVRLPAEFIRDQALAVSGLLDDRIGGASVSPYQPAGLWEELASRLDGKNWSAQTYEQSHGRDLYRRTMYTFWKRTSPPPTLSAFDAPDRETCTVRRSRTNTPLQALILLNDPTYVEAARKLGERIMTEGGTAPESRITFAFRLATARRPSADEIAILRDMFDGHVSNYRKNPAAALKLLDVGEAKRDQNLDPAELAAWSMVAATILNLDETITKG
jgi:hypothetical protein